MPMHREGHVGAALLVAAPLMWLAGTATDTLFGAILLTLGAVWATYIPDLDQCIPWIYDQGITHTVLFALIASTGGATVLTIGLWQFGSDSLTMLITSQEDLFICLNVGLLVGLVSHVCVDILTFQHKSRAIRPLWPIISRPIRLKLPRANSRVWSTGLLISGIAIQLAHFLCLVPTWIL